MLYSPFMIFIKIGGVYRGLRKGLFVVMYVTNPRKLVSFYL